MQHKLCRSGAFCAPRAPTDAGGELFGDFSPDFCVLDLVASVLQDIPKFSILTLHTLITSGATKVLGPG